MSRSVPLDASLPVAKGDEQITKLEFQRFLGKLSVDKEAEVSVDPNQ